MIAAVKALFNGIDDDGDEKMKMKMERKRKQHMGFIFGGFWVNFGFWPKVWL